MISTSTLADRRGVWAFVLGVIAVTAGVLLHAPMFWMGRHNHFVLYGMPIGWDMIVGMVAIVGGLGIAAYGLLPRDIGRQLAASQDIVVSPPEDAPLSRAHWILLSVLVIAVIIDIMNPASLRFTLPGMMAEYHGDKPTASSFSFAALTGRVVGSIVWGIMADILGRRASILLSAVMFVGTSICGAMPSLWWNVGMCFLMGAAAGGMLPVTYALLAETMPSKHRGWALVLVGGLGAAGGYLAASALSAWLVPLLSWRILWFLNLPTGLALIFLNVFIPESPKFLLALGRVREAHVVLRRFGCVVREGVAPAPPARAADEGVDPQVAVPRAYLAQTIALSIAALAWGLINFGLLLWMPAHLVAKGYS